MVFDIKIKTPKGAFFAAYFNRYLGDGNEVAAVMADQKKKISADVAHGLMGHMNDKVGQKAITHLGFELARPTHEMWSVRGGEGQAAKPA